MSKNPASGPAAFEPIKIVGVITESVSRPRGDGTAGSALYRVPIRLSSRPGPAWAAHFAATWDNPPRWTGMHRPGIARVSGDTLTLDGTTMEEVEQYHSETLRHVVAKVNADVAQHERDAHARAERDAEEARKHEATVSEIGSRLNFE